MISNEIVDEVCLLVDGRVLGGTEEMTSAVRRERMTMESDRARFNEQQQAGLRLRVRGKSVGVPKALS